MSNSTSLRTLQCACGTAFTVKRTSGRRACDDCALAAKRKAALAAYYRNRAKQGLPRRGDAMSATCDYCKGVFEYIFGLRKRSVCDPCQKKVSGQARKAWVQKNPDSIAAIKRRYRANNSLKVIEVAKRSRLIRYGVTPEWEAATLAAQDGKCGNTRCGAAEPGGRWPTWNIDHDHATGRPRGLLCSRCNKGVGLFDDDEEKLLGMIEYIRAYRSQPQ